MNYLNDNPLLATIAMVILSSLAVGVWWFFRQKKPKQSRKHDKEEEKGVYNCLIVDHKTHSFDLEHKTIGELERIQASCHGDIGRQWYYDKYEVYYLLKDKAGNYTQIKVPQTLESPPSLLYEALKQEDTEIIFDVKAKEGAFQKYGPYLIAAGIGAFVIVATMQQGG